MSKHTILFLAANPIGTRQRSLDREASAILAELQRSGHRDRFEFVTRWAVAPLDLLRELRTLRPTIVHFSGNAASRDASSGDDAHQRGLHFQDADGRAQFVSSQALQETFGAAGASVQLVVLQGCYCEAQAGALLAHIDCVVGTTGSITDDAARNYAIGLYGGLGERWSIAAAHRQGRAAIALQASSDSDGPQLRARDGVDVERLVLAAEALDPPAGSASTTLIIDRSSLRISDAAGESLVPTPPVIVWRDLPPPSAMDIFRLLDWRVRATPLIGREVDMQRLLDWARSDPPIQARFLVGRGGAGKTRLAFEVAERLRAEGWSAGQVFLDRASAIPFAGNGLFFVIDYPEAHRGQVTMLLREMARLERAARPVRILLLTRLPLKEWVSVIDAADAAGLCDTQDLSSLDTSGAALFRAAASRFAAHVQQAPPALAEDVLVNWIAQDEIQGLPVFIVAAALHCVMTQTSELGLTGSEVVAALVRREVKRLSRIGRDARCDDGAAARIVGLAAVGDGLSSAALRRLSEDRELGLPADQPLNAVKAMGLWQDSCVPPPTPDIVAAELLFEVLDDAADRAPAWLWACLADSAPAQVDGLGRIAYDIATLRGADALVRFASRLADSIDGNPQRAARWRSILDRETPIGVSRLAVSIGTCLLTQGDLEPAERASIHSSLSQRLSETGDRDGALVHSDRALEIWPRLADADIGRLGPDLARSLSTFAMCLRDGNDASSGAMFAEHAVDIWQELLLAAPGVHGPDMARSLRVWSICLSESGEHERALELCRRIVEFWRAASTSEPGIYEPELARSLNALAVELRQANR